MFDLSASMKNPINLSIGQPDFAVPEPIQAAAIDAIRTGKNGYSVTQGIPALREKLQAQIDQRFGHADRRVAVTSGTSGALVLAILALVEEGDEVVIFDPYFVMYPSLVRMVGGIPVFVETYPDFKIDIAQVEAALTDKTKLILLNSPGNPTGIVLPEAEVRAVAELAAERNIAVVSDEIYSLFCFDSSLSCPAQFNPDAIIIDGFSKTYGLTGWRVAYVHGPAAIIEEMIKLQQYTFVCAPQPFQWAAAAGMDVDMSQYVKRYHKRRDMLVEGLADYYEFAQPNGAFYLFPKIPWGSGQEFIQAAIEQDLLIIPGSVFSQRDSHFRISYATSEETLAQGIEVLQRIATR